VGGVGGIVVSPGVEEGTDKGGVTEEPVPGCEVCGVVRDFPAPANVLMRIGK